VRTPPEDVIAAAVEASLLSQANGAGMVAD
jgi:hypothetical protein